MLSREADAGFRSGLSSLVSAHDANIRRFVDKLHLRIDEVVLEAATRRVIDLMFTPAEEDIDAFIAASARRDHTSTLIRKKSSTPQPHGAHHNMGSDGSVLVGDDGHNDDGDPQQRLSSLRATLLEKAKEARSLKSAMNTLITTSASTHAPVTAVENEIFAFQVKSAFQRVLLAPVVAEVKGAVKQLFLDDFLDDLNRGTIQRQMPSLLEKTLNAEVIALSRRNDERTAFIYAAERANVKAAYRSGHYDGAQKAMRDVEIKAEKQNQQRDRGQAKMAGSGGDCGDNNHSTNYSDVVLTTLLHSIGSSEDLRSSNGMHNGTTTTTTTNAAVGDVGESAVNFLDAVAGVRTTPISPTAAAASSSENNNNSPPSRVSSFRVRPPPAVAPPAISVTFPNEAGRSAATATAGASINPSSNNKNVIRSDVLSAASSAMGQLSRTASVVHTAHRRFTSAASLAGGGGGIGSSGSNRGGGGGGGPLSSGSSNTVATTSGHRSGGGGGPNTINLYDYDVPAAVAREQALWAANDELYALLTRRCEEEERRGEALVAAATITTTARLRSAEQEGAARKAAAEDAEASLLQLEDMNAMLLDQLASSRSHEQRLAAEVAFYQRELQKMGGGGGYRRSTLTVDGALRCLEVPSTDVSEGTEKSLEAAKGALLTGSNRALYEKARPLLHFELPSRATMAQQEAILRQATAVRDVEDENEALRGRIRALEEALYEAKRRVLGDTDALRAKERKRFEQLNTQFIATKKRLMAAEGVVLAQRSAMAAMRERAAAGGAERGHGRGGGSRGGPPPLLDLSPSALGPLAHGGDLLNRIEDLTGRLYARERELALLKIVGDAAAIIEEGRADVTTLLGTDDDDEDDEEEEGGGGINKDDGDSSGDDCALGGEGDEALAFEATVVDDCIPLPAATGGDADGADAPPPPPLSATPTPTAAAPQRIVVRNASFTGGGEKKEAPPPHRRPKSRSGRAVATSTPPTSTSSAPSPARWIQLDLIRRHIGTLSGASTVGGSIIGSSPRTDASQKKKKKAENNHKGSSPSSTNDPLPAPTPPPSSPPRPLNVTLLGDVISASVDAAGPPPPPPPPLPMTPFSTMRCNSSSSLLTRGAQTKRPASSSSFSRTPSRGGVSGGVGCMSPTPPPPDPSTVTTPSRVGAALRAAGHTPIAADVASAAEHARQLSAALTMSGRRSGRSRPMSASVRSGQFT